MRRWRLGSLAVWLAATVSLVVMVDPSVATASVPDAVTWLSQQQQPDGGFELAGFTGFETADAALAVAESAQPASGAWDAEAARNAVLAISTDDGLTAYDALDDEAEAAPAVAAAAKLVFMVSAPGGWDGRLHPVAFDPGEDGNPIDLTSGLIEPSADGSFGSFTDTVFAVLVQPLLCRPVAPASVDLIRAAAASNGGWNFAGDPNDPTFDPDTTGRVLQALGAAGLGIGDPTIDAAIALASREHDRSTGAWLSFGEANPNSTATMVLGLAAIGIDVDQGAWRETADPTGGGGTYVSPRQYLADQQDLDGRYASPSDSFGVNTFATTQTIQALTLGWNPGDPGLAASVGCPPTELPVALPGPTSTIPPTTANPTATSAPPAPSTMGTATTSSAQAQVRAVSTTQGATRQTLAQSGPRDTVALVIVAAALLLSGRMLVRRSQRASSAGE